MLSCLGSNTVYFCFTNKPLFSSAMLLHVPAPFVPHAPFTSITSIYPPQAVIFSADVFTMLKHPDVQSLLGFSRPMTAVSSHFGVPS